MKQTSLEPGLVHVLRVYVIFTAVFLPLIWRAYSPMVGVEAGLDQFLTPGYPAIIFLVIYMVVPWWQRHMGRAFLPLALFLLAAQTIFGNYLTLLWLVPSRSREVAALALMVRMWIPLQFLVLFVAWQYNLFWVMVTGVTACLLDAALTFAYVHVGGVFYPFYLAIVVARLFSVTAVGLGLAWLMKRQREQRAALTEANRKLAQYAATTEQLAASHERNRLARELHDTLAHSLSGVTVQLEAVQALWELNASEARRILDQALHHTRAGLTEARRALQALRASPLDDLGLALALRTLAESVAARTSLKLEADLPNQVEHIAPEAEQCVYRIAQEALTNVARHADARVLRVALARQDGHLSLTIADDGRGFDPAAVDPARFGLRGLRERAEMFGGILQVESALQRGTTVRLVLPVAEVRQ